MIDRSVLMKALTEKLGHRDFSISEKDGIWRLHCNGESSEIVYSDIEKLYKKHLPEQVEKERLLWIKKTLRQQFSLEDELKILREAIGGKTENFTAYDTAVKNIIAESKIKDSQASKGVHNK